MENLELKEYAISSIYEWFNINYRYFRYRKEQKLEELKIYCNYEFLSPTKIKITKIRCDTYNKYHMRDFLFIRKTLKNKWDYENLNSIDVLTNIYYNEREENRICFNKECLHECIKIVIEERFGEFSYVWGKMNENGKCVYLNNEEEKIKREIFDKYYKNAIDKIIFMQQNIDEGIIKNAEAWNKYNELININDNLEEFLKEYKNKTGIELIKCIEFKK